MPAVSTREMTHHHNVVVKDAANIESAGGTTTEPMAFVEGLRMLVGAVGAQSHGCVPALRRIGERTLDERIGDATAPPRRVDVALGQVRSVGFNLSGAHAFVGDRSLADDRQCVPDEDTINFGDQDSVPLWLTGQGSTRPQ